MMALVYHGTPVSPLTALRALGPRAFCISFEARSRRSAPHVERQSPFVMYDNGEFARYTAAKRGGTEDLRADWRPFFDWLNSRLFEPGRWAVIPDVIDAGSQMQDALIAEWPFGHRGAPVWHTDEPLDRLLRLIDEWPRVCFGSSGEHWQVGGPDWTARMDEVWGILGRRRHVPVIHMLRGVAVANRYPFDSADSTGFAQSMHRYRQPLFAGTPDEWTGIVAFADRLEKRAASRRLLLSPAAAKTNRDRERLVISPGPLTLAEGAPVRDLLTYARVGNQ
ncbi:MAG: hypothetical protein WKF79_00110 [Nocardioides sp.]